MGEATNIERDRFDVWWASIERAMNERNFTKAEIARAAWAAAWAAQDANQQALDAKYAHWKEIMIEELRAECDRWKEIMTDELAETRRLMDLGGAREGENFTAFLERMIAERGHAS